jgi:hypothetical protein
VRAVTLIIFAMWFSAPLGLAAEKPALSSQSQAATIIGEGLDAAGHSGISLLVRDGVPAAAFFLHKAPKEKTRFAFLVLFKGVAKPGESAALVGGGRSSNHAARMTGTVKFAGKEAEVTYAFKEEKGKPTFAEESLKLGGKEVKLADARVFLADLTADKIEFVPVPGDLPAAPAIDDKNALDSWDKAVQSATAELKKRSPAEKKFFD